EFARLDPERQTAYVVGFQIGDLPRTGAGGAVVIENWSFHDGMLGEAREKGRGLYVWTVNDLSDQRDYLARVVDGIITDEVDRAVAARERLHAGALTLYLEQAHSLLVFALGLALPGAVPAPRLYAIASTIRRRRLPLTRAHRSRVAPTPRSRPGPR